jgi:UDP-N-acetyl-D-mannosaminuronate dehydrogenase
VLLVNHTEFKRLDPRNLVSINPARVILDTVGAWKPETWEAAGFNIHRLGVSKRDGDD